MRDWFVVVDGRGVDDPRPAEVFECVDYRMAVALANRLAQDESLSVEVSDFEGRIVRAIGLDQWDGTQGFTSVPLRAGLYRWQAASECYRLVSP